MTYREDATAYIEIADTSANNAMIFAEQGEDRQALGAICAQVATARGIAALAAAVLDLSETIRFSSANP